jgi:hypothetical protein
LVIFFSSANVKIRAPRSCGTLVLVLFISKEAADGSATSVSNQHANQSIMIGAMMRWLISANQKTGFSLQSCLFFSSFCR